MYIFYFFFNVYAAHFTIVHMAHCVCMKQKAVIHVFQIWKLMNTNHIIFSSHSSLQCFMVTRDCSVISIVKCLFPTKTWNGHDESSSELLNAHWIGLSHIDESCEESHMHRYIYISIAIAMQCYSSQVSVYQKTDVPVVGIIILFRS